MTVFSPLSRSIRLHGKTPVVTHGQLSYPLLLRDVILDHVKQMPFFASGFTFSTDKAQQIQPESLPFCGVYFLQEVGGADAEPQTGPIGFRTTVRIGFSVIIIYSDHAAGEYELDRAAQALSGLFSDPTLYNNSLVRVQGFTGLSRQHVFGNTGQNNETPVAELRWELICDLGTITYPPNITDDFETMHVETHYPFGNEDTPPVVVEYDLSQN